MNSRALSGIFKPLILVPIAVAISLIVSFPCFSSVTGNDIAFEHAINFGGNIQSIAQDQEGFLWIGSVSGVYRYDGYELKPFTVGRNSLSTNYAPVVFADTTGLVWIGTIGGGLNVYDKSSNTFTVFKHDPKDTNTPSNDNFNWKPQMIAEDPDGLIWFGTQWGLNSYDKETGRFTRYLHDPNDPNSLSDNYIWSVAVDDEGLVWIGTKHGGLNSYDKHRHQFTHYRHTPGDPNTIGDDWVYGVTPDRDDIIWVGTKTGGLGKLDKKTGGFTHYIHDPSDPESLGHNEVSHIEIDSKGNLWLARSYSTPVGVEMMDREIGKFRRFTANPANPSRPRGNIIMQSFEDSSGIMWFVENAGTIDKIDSHAKKFKFFKHIPTDPGSISARGVTTIFEDRNKDIWLGTFMGGINRYNKSDDTFTAYKHDPGDPASLSHNYAFSVFEDSSGVFWVGTDDGMLSIFNRDTGKVEKRFKNPHTEQVARSIIEDKLNPGVLWFGTEANGLYKFDKETGTYTQYKNNPRDPNSLSDNGMYCLHQDDDGTLWIGTLGGGLNRFNRQADNFASYRHDWSDVTTISGNIINDMHRDSRGVLWISTDDGGLNRFDDATETFKRYNRASGFPTNSIKGIVVGPDGNLWLGSTIGLFRFDPEKEEIINHYTRNDGLHGNEFSMYATGDLLASDGVIWFAGGTEGLNVFNPLHITNNPFVPPVVLTSLKQSGAELDMGKAFEKVEKVVLNWDHNFFEFEFAALSYTNSDKNQYMYMLAGFDKNWYPSGTRRFGRYSGLPAGRYNLRIKGANNDGVWNHDGVSIEVIVTPPFWMSKWIYALYVLIAGIIAIGYPLLQKRRLEKVKLLNKRLRHVDKLKDEFLANTSHELKTPLNGIIGLTESMIEGVGGTKTRETVSHLKMIATSARQLDNLVNDILDFSKLEHEDINLSLQQVDIRTVSEVVLTLISPLAGAKKIRLANEIPRNLPLVEADENRVQQILYNLVGNGVKFNTPGGTVTVHAKQSRDVVEITVADTGIGISRDKMEYIFAPFKQADGSIERQYGGTGLGLTVSRQLVELHGGRIDVSSRVGVGSRFRFSLKIADPSTTLPRKTGSDLPLDVSKVYQNWGEPEPIAEAAEIAPAKVALKPHRILIVDDEPVNLQVLNDYLTLENYPVSAATSGAEALLALAEASAENQPFSLVLIDVMMPKMSGYDLCLKIRKDHPADMLPVIMLTAKNRVDDLVLGFRAGANDYVAKPFSKAEIMARLETLLYIKELAEEREGVRKALAKSEERFRSLVETTIDRVFETDSRGYCTYSSPQVREILGYEVEDVIGKHLFDFIPEDRGKRVRDKAKHLLENPRPVYDCNTFQKRKNGEIVAIETNAKPFYDESGEFQGYRGIDRDITQRKAAENELKSLRNLLASIVDFMPSMLIGIDKAYRITQWNRKVQSETGLSPETTQRMNLYKALPQMKPIKKHIEDAIKNGQAFNRLKTPHDQGDIRRFMDITVYPLFKDGLIEGAVIRLDDVTDKVRLEEMIIQNEKMLSVGGLAAGIAHEINNPLAGMMQTAMVMKNRLADMEIPANQIAAEEIGVNIDDIKAYMEKRDIPQMILAINESGHRIAGIVDNMLSFARKDERRATHSLTDLFDKALELAASDYDLRRHYDFREIEIIKDYDDSLPPVPCEGAKIQQVLLNILRNGAQAMQAAGTVRPRLIARTQYDETRKMACMELEDNGPGMDEETRKRAFEPFFTTKTVGVGTGLGLSVSYFIITEHHGGEMAVESLPGSGSIFIIRLPVEEA